MTTWRRWKTRSGASILACRPAKLILVTTRSRHKALKKMAKGLRSPGSGNPVIEVLHVDKANKRVQVCKALEEDHVKTPMTIMADDDDVEWPPTLMPWILAPFEDDKMGGVGTSQRVKRVDGDFITRSWNWLGAAYIERRNFEISATHNIDGGTSCTCLVEPAPIALRYSGGTTFWTASRTRSGASISSTLMTTTFVTRWLVSQQWKTWVQYEPECEIETTLENSAKFLYQCSRWARSNWRSNWTSLSEGYVFTCCYPCIFHFCKSALLT